MASRESAKRQPFNVALGTKTALFYTTYLLT